MPSKIKEDDIKISLSTKRAWRRVASTHSLEDLLSENCCDESTNTPTPGQRIMLLSLGIFFILAGLLGLALGYLVVRHCGPSSMSEMWSHPASCDAIARKAYHRVVVEFGVFTIFLPTLKFCIQHRVFSRWLGLHEMDDVVLRFASVVERYYTEHVDAASSSANVMYLLALIPIVCGPVTVLAVAVNWASMKVFKHNSATGSNNA